MKIKKILFILYIIISIISWCYVLFFEQMTLDNFNEKRFLLEVFFNICIIVNIIDIGLNYILKHEN